MKRREFIMLAGAAAVSPSTARAQKGQVTRVGVLMAGVDSDPQAKRRAVALEEGLRKLGWEIGRKIEIDYRWGASGLERAEAQMAELLRSHPDIVIANAVDAARAAQKATTSVPIVFIGVSEPVFLGLVASLSHPGANITGLTNFEPGIGEKWVALLKQIAPGIKRVGFVTNPNSTFATAPFHHSIETAGKALGLETLLIGAREPADIEAGMARLNAEGGAAFIVQPDPYLVVHRKLIIGLAAQYRLPAMYPFNYFPKEEGLMSYGPDLVDEFRRAAGYIDRILHGEKAADLPVQQPIKFEFIINIKVAKSLGLEVPPTLIALADEVVE